MTIFLKSFKEVTTKSDIKGDENKQDMLIPI